MLIKSNTPVLKSVFRLLDWSKPSRSMGLFVLSFEDNAVRTGHIGLFLPKLELKYYNVMIDGRNFYDQSVTN